MKKSNLLIYGVLVIGAYFYFIHSANDKTDDITKENKSVPVIPERIEKSENIPEDVPAPRDLPYDELPEDIKKAALFGESNNPDDLPPDLKAQLNAPPPELPEDLRRQLEMGPQELPADLKAQLEGPPPPIPDDIKRALAIPPRVVSIDEVNNPRDTSDEEVIE